MVLDGDDQYAFGVHVPRDAVLRIWPTSTPLREIRPALAANRGGRTNKWDWEGAYIEMARLLHMADDPPRNRPELSSLIKDWFVARVGNHPADSLIREKVKRFWDEMTPPT